MRRFIYFSEARLGEIWNRILFSTDVSPANASLFRIVFGLFMLLFAMPNFGWLADVPQGLFNPPVLSVAALFNDFLPGIIFKSADLVIVALVLMITLGVATRWASLLLTGASLFLSSFAYSFGKIDHDILFRIIPLCLAWSGWGGHYAIWPDRKLSDATHRRSLAIFGLVIAFGMFTAGFEKAYVWVDFDLTTSGFLSWFYSGYFSLGRHFLLAPLILRIPPPYFEIADYSAVAFELSGGIFLWLGRKWWLRWLLIACAFHLVNILVLNIAFVAHAVVYGLFLLPSNFNRFERESNGFGRRFYSLLIFFPVALALSHAIQRLFFTGSEFLFLSDPAIAREYDLYVAMGVWSVLILVGIKAVTAKS